MECLSIFGSQAAATTTVTLDYKSSSARFELSLEEQGIFTTCSLPTIETDEYTSESWSQMTTAFTTSRQVCKAIMKSEHLKEALYELQDLQGAHSVKVVMAPHAPFFQLAAKGNLGSLEIEFSKTSDLFVLFECEGSYEWEYPLKSLLFGMRALVVAAETFIRINDQGVMCIQHQILAASGKKCFVEFLMQPNEDDDEDAEAAESSSGPRRRGQHSDEEEEMEVPGNGNGSGKRRRHAQQPSSYESDSDGSA